MKTPLLQIDPVRVCTIVAIVLVAVAVNVHCIARTQLLEARDIGHATAHDDTPAVITLGR